jgi:hypothetical protein
MEGKPVSIPNIIFGSFVARQMNRGHNWLTEEAIG